MPFRPPPRLASVLASVLAAGLMLTVASCSHLTPLGRSYVGLGAFILLTWDFMVWRGWLVST